MSVPPPYQSKLFNFLNRQSRRFSDRWAQKLRQTQVATVWGLQAALYPVYLFWQTTRLGVKQLKQQVKQSRRQFQPAVDQVSSDLPILQTLQTIAVFLEAPDPTLKPESPKLVLNLEQAKLTAHVSNPVSAPKLIRWLQHFTPGRLATSSAALDHEQVVSASPKSQHLTLQGIATLLTSRNLVLVAPDNQILDILTPRQQDQLQQRLSWKMAEYARQMRRVQRLNQGQFQLSDRPQHLPLPPIQDQPTLLPPLRLFQQLMAWVQTSPVAIATNVFQESTLLPSPTAAPEKSPKLFPGISWLGRSLAPTLISTQALAAADQAIATLERDPVSSVVHATTTLKLHTQQLWQWVRLQLRSPLLAASEPTADLEVLNQETTGVRLPVTRQNWFSRAITYLNAPRSLVCQTPPQLDADAKTTKVNIKFAACAQKERPNLDATATAQASGQRGLGLNWGYWLGHIGGKLVKQGKTAKSTPARTATYAPVPTQVAAGSYQAQPCFGDRVQDIEVDPVFIGYEKHLLTQILEWLDQVVAWIEALLTRLIQQWLPGLKHQYDKFFYPRSPQD